MQFIAVGGAATALQYLVLAVLTAGAHWPAGWASGLGYLAGAGLGYALNRSLTFASRRAHRQALPRYALMVATGWGITTATVGGLADLGGLNPWLAQLLATALALCWNFVAAKNWVFRSAPAS